MQENTSITSVNLGRNSIKHAGAEALAAMLKVFLLFLLLFMFFLVSRNIPRCSRNIPVTHLFDLFGHSGQQDSAKASVGRQRDRRPGHDRPRGGSEGQFLSCSVNVLPFLGYRRPSVTHLF